MKGSGSFNINNVSWQSISMDVKVYQCVIVLRRIILYRKPLLLEETCVLHRSDTDTDINIIQ